MKLPLKVSDTAFLAILLLLGCTSTPIYETTQRLEQDGKFAEAGYIWLREANAKLEKRDFSASEFFNAARSFDQDPKRSSDALAARKLAAARAMKEGEYRESKFQNYSAFWSYDMAADIFKDPYGLKKDLDDLASAENARLLAIKNWGIALRSGESKLDTNALNIMSNQYFVLVKLVSLDEKKRDAYKQRGDAHIKSLQDYMPTANRIAQEKAARETSLEEERRREAIEEKARREKSNRDFANSVSTATAMMRTTQGSGASSPGYARSGQSQSQGECIKIKGDPSCYVGACNKSGGKAVVKRNNLGCGMVYCNYPDGKNNSAHVYDYLPGSGCAGSVK